MDNRRKTRQVKVKNLIIGGGFPVSVQTMWKESLNLPIESALVRIKKLALFGCDILRIAVPKTSDVEYVGKISEQADIPIVADIHFNYKIALQFYRTPASSGIEKKKFLFNKMKLPTLKGGVLTFVSATRRGAHPGQIPFVSPALSGTFYKIAKRFYSSNMR